MTQTRNTTTTTRDETGMATAPRARRRARGMSLLEIMVVITLIGLVTAVIGVNVFRSLVGGQVKVARAQAHELAQSVQLYRLEKGKLPSTGDGLAVLTTPPPIVEKLPNDPWGNPFAYVVPGTRNPHSFDIASRGPDGLEGTDDDVGNWDGKSDG